MRILVTAASGHGATAEIAVRIGAGLAARGFDVDVKAPEDAADVGVYDAFVVGSAVYFGQWLKPAKHFVEAHADELAEHPTWLFSSGPIVGDPPPADDPRAVSPALREALVERTHAREHKVFPGKLDMSKLNWCEKIGARCAHAREGDHRDWEAIDGWAAAVAHELRPSGVLG